MNIFLYWLLFPLHRLFSKNIKKTKKNTFLWNQFIQCRSIGSVQQRKKTMQPSITHILYTLTKIQSLLVVIDGDGQVGTDADGIAHGPGYY